MGLFVRPFTSTEFSIHQYKMKKRISLLVAIVVIYGLIELLSSIGLRILANRYEPVDVISKRHVRIINKILHDTSSYIKFSKDLGWTIREFGKTELYTANSAGIRSAKEYGFIPPAGKFRVMVCGDGFTHCNDVRNGQEWPALLEQMNTEWEVLNLGVWCYGLDQVYLRYLRKGREYKSHIVLIGFGSENVFRLVNTYRPFIFRHTGLPLTKPRFRIENGTLELIPNPMQRLDDYKTLLDKPKEIIPKLGINDYYYKQRTKSSGVGFLPSVRLAKLIFSKWREKRSDTLFSREAYSENSESFDIMIKLIDTFHECVVENGSIPVFCIFPLEKDIKRYWENGTRQYTPLLLHFEEKGIKYIDAVHAFDNLDKDFNTGDLYIHLYTVIGNNLVADYISKSLKHLINETKIVTVP
jgi:hypothetical protein